MSPALDTALLRDAFWKALTSPSLWLMALCLIAAEAGCNAQARSYPDGVTTEYRFDGQNLSIDGQSAGEAGADMSLFVHHGTVLVADGIAVIRGQRDASGAEAIGAVLGTWAAAIPTALLLLVIGAWLLPGYYRNQVEGATGKPSFKPGTEAFRRVLAVRAIGAVAVGGTAALGAIPGIALLAVAGSYDITPLAVVGMVLTVVGAVGGWLYVLAGLLFADREAVLGRLGTKEALLRSWDRGRGRRLRRLSWALGAWTIEALGSLGWIAWFVGFFTHPIARAAADTILTRLYLRETAEE